MPQVCANVMTATPLSPREINADIPEALAAVVLRCLDKNRDTRFPDVAALSRCLKDFGGSAASVRAGRVERILERARSTVQPAPVTATAAGAESWFLSVHPPAQPAPEAAPDSVEDAPLSIAGLRQRQWGVVLGVLVLLVSASAAVLLWRRASLHGEPGPVVSSAAAAPAPSDQRERAAAPAQGGAPARASATARPPAAPKQNAPDAPGAKETAQKVELARTTPNGNQLRVAAKAAKPSEPAPLAVPTSIYPELKAPELPSPSE
jgi:serine/threonine-protein kinase